MTRSSGSPRPESEFATIADLHAALSDLVGRGFGELPVQVLVVPGSTLQTLARAEGAVDDDKPALMIEFGGDSGRFPVSILSTEYLDVDSKRVAVQ